MDAFTSGVPEDRRLFRDDRSDVNKGVAEFGLKEEAVSITDSS
jgi:hypothetical protein